MLSKFDDYPIHQTAEPIARPASTDRNVYDRYWFNGYDRDGEFYFGIGMGVYPIRGIIDCAFSIVRDGEQHAFHGSSRLPAEHGETVCGPFSIDIVQPMRQLRVTLDDNDTGIACELTFDGRTANVEEAGSRWTAVAAASWTRRVFCKWAVGPGRCATTVRTWRSIPSA